MPTKLAVLEQKLDRAVRALIKICQTGEEEICYPEMVGAMESIAASALADMGNPEWQDKLIKKYDEMTKRILSDYGDRPGSPAAANSPQGRAV
jgi:hypothetical protein